GRGVEVVVHPHRLPRTGLRLLREAPHGGPVLLRRDTHQIETPALRNEDPESHGASLGVPGQHVVDSRVGRRPPRLVVSNVTEVEAFSWSTVMRGSLSRAV